MIDYIVKTLEKLVNIPSVSGYYFEIVKFIESEIKSFENKSIEIKNLKRGGIFLTLKGSNSESGTVLSAHADTLGAMVKEILPNGYIKFVPIGGYSLLTILGNYCTIHTSDKKYKGTIVPKKASVHAFSHDMEKDTIDTNNIIIRLDEIVKTKEDVVNLGINVGDFITFDPNFKVENTFIKSRHLDDKLGVAILLGALKNISENKLKFTKDLYFLFSVFEEVGFGANITFPSNIDEAIVVDNGVMGDGQTTTEYTVTICAKDSASHFSYEMKEKLVKICKENGINYVIDVYPHYGSDLAQALRAGNDFKSILVSFGVDASHCYERTNIKSIEETYKLVISYLNTLVRG